MVSYLSVCSGIEAASVAWGSLGWQPLAFSEIEAFPRAVLAHHYPGVPIHGDFTKLRDEPWIANADVLVGGTPCQAFSVAGLRNSLADERGNLSLEYVRLANAIDHLRLSAGREPCIIVWENVPGVLSVKDNAFGSFLGGLAGEDVQLEPSGKRWTDAGCVFGPQRAIAWRIQDAQYHQLAQRRRRVFVVASARDRFDPAAVLLEFEGLRRDTPPRRETREIAPTIPSRSTAGGGLGTDFDLDGGVITLAHGQAGDEIARERSPTLTCVHEAPIAAIPVTHTLRAEGFDASEDGTGRGTPLVPVNVSHTLQTQCGFATEDGTGRGSPLVPVAFSYKDSGNDASTDLSPTLRALGAYDANGGGQMAVAVPLQEVGKRTGISTEDRRAGIGVGQGGDPMFTLQAGAQHGVAYPLDLRNAGRDPEKHDAVNRQGLGIGEDGDPSPTLSTAFVPGVAAYAFQPRIARNGRGDMGDLVNALTMSGETGKGDTAPCVAVADTLGVGANQTSGFESEVVATRMLVRRLVPVEAERLQGFPDSYTAIPWRNRPAEDCPDGPRYKALGNSMAVPCMRWIGQRIAAYMECVDA